MRFRGARLLPVCPLPGNSVIGTRNFFYSLVSFSAFQGALLVEAVRVPAFYQLTIRLLDFVGRGVRRQSQDVEIPACIIFREWRHGPDPLSWGVPAAPALRSKSVPACMKRGQAERELQGSRESS